MGRTTRVVAAVAAAVFLLLSVGRADGQEIPDLPETPEPPVPVPDVPGTLPPPPDIPLPEAPPELDPLLEASAPLTNQACKVFWTVATNVSKVPALSNLALALVGGPNVEAIPSAGPYFDMLTTGCGVFPGPEQLSRCMPDREADAALETVLGLPGVSATGAVFGLTGIQIDLPTLGAVLDTARALEEAGAPVPVSAVDPVYDQLECEDVLGEGFGAPDTPDPLDPPDIDLPVEPTAVGTSGVERPDPAASPAPSPSSGEAGSGPVPIQPDTGTDATTVGGPGLGGQDLAVGTPAAETAPDGSNTWRTVVQVAAFALLAVAMREIIRGRGESARSLGAGLR